MIVLIGMSGTGKSTLEKLSCKYSGYNKIVSYTTRQKRLGEANHVDYHFIKTKDFLEKVDSGFLIEHVLYNKNYYGIAKEDCKKDSIVVVEPNGLRQLRNINSIDLKAILLTSPRELRINRMIERGDEMGNALNRVKIDEEVFKGIEEYCDYELKNEGTIEELEDNFLSLLIAIRKV